MLGLRRAAPLLFATCFACGGLAEGAPDELRPDPSLPAIVPAAATLFVNFDGAELQFGSVNDAAAGVTTLGDGPGPYLIAAPSLGRFIDDVAPTRARVIEQIMHQVRTIYSPFDIAVVTERPERGPFTMLAVGNHFGEIHFAAACPLAGLAVRDCSGDEDGDVGFAAADCVPTGYAPAAARRLLARTIAHEAGHTFGLTHNENEASMMSPNSTGIALGEGPVPLEDQASCQRTTQDDFAVLHQVLGLRSER